MGHLPFLSCGSASLAAMEVLANASQEGRARPRFRVDCVEPSDALRGAGRAILPEAFWGKSLGSLRRAEYDVALCTFALGELGTRRERSGAVRRLWSRLRPGGVLLCLQYLVCELLYQRIVRSLCIIASLQ